MILQACGDLGLCNKTEAVVVAASAGQNSNDLNCPLCEFLVSMLKEQLEDKDTEVELLAKAAEASQSSPSPSSLPSLLPQSHWERKGAVDASSPMAYLLDDLRVICM